MKSARIPYQIAVVLLMLLCTTPTRAQLSTGGDVAGGYLWIDPHLLDSRLKHLEGNGSLWLGYKAGDYDWRLTLTGKYKDVEGESEIFDLDLADKDNLSLTVTSTETSDKPLNLSARYDFNWRRHTQHASPNSYTLWTQYDYEHAHYDASSWSVTSSVTSDYVIAGAYQDKRDVCHKVSVGYSGTTRLNALGWVLKSSADVSLQKWKVDDDWQRFFRLTIGLDVTPMDTLEWVMHPDYTDYAFNAALELTDTVFSRPASRLVLGGGLRFKGEGERFSHDVDAGDDIGDAMSVEQQSTGFRFFAEPFLNAVWRSGKWLVNAEYGLRLYHTNTTENTGHAVQLYSFMNLGEVPLTGRSFSHFTPLVNGSARLTYAISRHHSLSLSNSLSNRLPSNQQAVLAFVQTNEHNKVSLGNPHLKPEVRIQFSLNHTLTYGPFSATTSVSAERTNNLMESYLFKSKLGGRGVIVRMTLNDADVSTYRVSETLAWNNKWLKANATIWRHWAHYQGIGSIRGGREVDDKNWGWSLNVRADLGCGWLVATNFRFMGGYQTIASRANLTWQSSTVSIEKRFKPVTLYLTANRLVDPSHILRKYNSDGYEIYENISRSNNRIVMLGCRWGI